MRILIVLLLLVSVAARAEPFLAVAYGYQCSQCHVSPTGGGMRNSFGAQFSRSLLPSRPGAMDKRFAAVTGDVIGLGVDSRFAVRQREVSGVDGHLGFATDRVTMYVTAKVSNDVRLYVDQKMSPGGSINREAWAKVSFEKFYVRAGRLFLPYGMRIEDDSAYIRQFTNINFDTPDNGIEIGHVGDHISAQLSVTNGTGGAAEVDDGKMVSARAAWVERRYRVGVSMNRNDTDAGIRNMYGLFLGARTGPVGWIAEYDRVRDEFSGLRVADYNIGLVEADWKLMRGNFVRVAIDLLQSPTDSLATSRRYSVSYLWFPMPMTELRIMVRKSSSDSPDPFANGREYLAQLHVFF